MNIREYEILETIGQPGGMGVVYKAKHQSLEVIRAIKKLHFHLATNTTIIQRFENEARALSILEHPNIVRVYDFFKEEDSYYLVMEYVDGPSLAEVLKKSALSVTVALEYLKQIISTMAFAHDKKILHRDIKPSNILIDHKGVIKVVDFGIAKMMDRKGLTSTGMTMGSPWYMSPEQIVGQELDERSDIYSLGITLFEMLTAQVPFNDTSEYKILEMHQKKPIPSLKEFDKKFSSDLDAIIKKATAKKPADRYQSAREFAEAIDIYLALSGLGASTGSTIADFDPSEYLKQGETKTDSEIEIDLPTSFTTSEKVSEAEVSGPQPADDKTGIETPADDTEKKRTSYQQATVFQDVTKTGTSPRATSDLIDKKAITGLPTSGKQILSKKILYILGGAVVLLVAVVFIIMKSLSPGLLEVQPSEISYTSVQFTWNGVKNANYYEISRKTSTATAFNPIANIQSTSFIDTTVHPGEDYRYQITAKKEDGGMIANGEIDVTTPVIDFDLSAIDISSKEVSLTWKPIEASRNFLLYRRDLDSKSDKEPKEIYTGTDNSFTDSGLLPEHDYSYFVKVEFENQRVYDSRALDLTTEAKSTTAAVLAFGDLMVNSTPPGAKVYMDGQELGDTPFTRKGLKTGLYKIAVKKEGFAEYTESVRIGANRATRIAPILVASIGKVDILVKPYGSITIDGELLKKDTPTKFTTELPSGKHRVAIVHSGLGARWEKTIELGGGKTENIIVDFTKMVTVTVLSKPWATIFVDGKSTGEVTPKQIQVRVGRHTFSVQREGYEMVGDARTLNIEKDLSQPLEFTLDQK